MPKEGGRELAASLVPRRPAMKVLFMSGYTDQAGVSSGLPAGVSGFIQKPFTPATLAGKVREILEGNGETTRRAGR
jgi:DNA-binding NarL/FixJ family response regulator